MSSGSSEIERLRRELQEAQQTLQAIQNGEVDAFVVQRRGLYQIETLGAAHTPYQVLVESIQDGALTISRAGVVLYCNRPFADKVAGTAAKVIGRQLSDWLTLDACALDALLDRALSGEAWETGILRCNGRKIPIAVTACALPSEDDDKNVFCLLLRDQSDRVEAEELRLERARLARQRAELDAICKCLPFAVLLAERPTSFNYLNPAAEQLLEGYPELQLRVETVIRDAARGVTVEGEEAVVPNPSGESTFRVYATRSALEGFGNAVLVVLEDVTGQRLAERERQRQEQLREMFVGILGHDLRAPLMAVATAATLLRRGQFPEKVVRTAERIQRASDRMTVLINDMLDFTVGRIGGGIPLTPVACNLRQLVSASIEELESDPNSRIIIDSKGDVSGHWDAVRLAQVISNLLTNAIEYGTPSTPIRIALNGTKADHVQLAVTNEGPAIPAEIVPHIFEAFRRGGSEPPGRRRGTGLGLYIAERVVSAHGGTISVRSIEGEGTTTFLVELPRQLERG